MMDDGGCCENVEIPIDRTRQTFKGHVKPSGKTRKKHMRDDLVFLTAHYNILEFLTEASHRLMPMPTKGAYSVGYFDNEHGTISAVFSALLSGNTESGLRAA